jgi:ATP-dependent DNA helicase RecG
LLRRIHFVEAWGRGIPLILDKAPNVRFNQIAGIFITEFPRPESGLKSGAAREQVTGQVTGQVAGEVTGEVTGEVKKLLMTCREAMSRTALQKILRLTGADNFRRLYLVPALEAGLIEMTLPDKPNSRLQKYRLTPKGRAALSPAPSK